MTIAQDEIFGPVISAIPFRDMDDPVRRANQMFGLGSGVWTRAAPPQPWRPEGWSVK
jgi:aldehyde dehydrogenase (NAD+)